MSKINIEAILKSKNETHTFKGKGIKKDNQIIYNDKNVQTKVTIGNEITIERKVDQADKVDYHLKINLKKGIIKEGTYITNYGTFNLKTITINLINQKNEFKITYKLFIDETYIDTFTYYLKFTLDT